MSKRAIRETIFEPKKKASQTKSWHTFVNKPGGK